MSAEQVHVATISVQQNAEVKSAAWTGLFKLRVTGAKGVTVGRTGEVFEAIARIPRPKSA